DQKRLLKYNIKIAMNGVFSTMREIVRSRVPKNSKNDEGDPRHPARLYETVDLNKATVSTNAATLSTENEIWYYYNEDMPAHLIEPRSSASDMVAGTSHQALSFIWKGKRVFFKSVHHPGSKGKHYWDEADQYMRAILPQMTKMAGDMALRGEIFTGGETGPLTDSGSYSFVTAGRI
ncbi:MAG: hypothetical protein ACREDR_24315, partial [Blastocatellia bacterium]